MRFNRLECFNERVKNKIKEIQFKDCIIKILAITIYPLPTAFGDFILKGYLSGCAFISRKLAAAVIAKMVRDAVSVTESEEDFKMLKSQGASVSLPKHSYWFDFWLFVLFDLAFFFVVYFIVP